MKSRIVVCSKTDLRVKKAVDRQSARDFCRRVGCTYIEQCSNSSEGRDKLLEVPSAFATHLHLAANGRSLLFANRLQHFISQMRHIFFFVCIHTYLQILSSSLGLALEQE